MPRRSDRFPTETLLQLLNRFQPSTIRYCRRVFVNRNLRMKKIQAVGFDMDYTLAQYRPEFEQLAWELSLDRLVRKFGFPKEALHFKYDHNFALRGLIIDMVHGNIIKMDRHRHVWRAYHGTQPIDIAERNKLYRQRRIQLSKPVYFQVDTLFSLPETHMYAQMVDLLDSLGKDNPESYRHAYNCIRKAVDGIHRDGTLKSVVLKNLSRYVERDPDMPHTLERFIYSGKKLFLATNSDWAYTDAVMSYLLDSALEPFSKWHEYFEHIVVEADKPEFFTARNPLVHEDTAAPDLQHKIFKHGNLRAFEGLLNCSGEKILYVGDHIFGDILRSKKSSTWRTAMIIPEMERELLAGEDVQAEIARGDELFRRRLHLEIETNYHQRMLLSLLNLDELAQKDNHGNNNAISRVVEASESNMAEIRKALERTEVEQNENNLAVSRRFNPFWGMLFRERAAHTVFAEQVEDWACVYTSRVSNFLSYSPLHYYRSARDLLPHEREC